MSNRKEFDLLERCSEKIMCVYYSRFPWPKKQSPCGLFFDFSGEKRYALCGLIINKSAQEVVD